MIRHHAHAGAALVWKRVLLQQLLHAVLAPHLGETVALNDRTSAGELEKHSSHERLSRRANARHNKRHKHESWLQPQGQLQHLPTGHCSAAPFDVERTRKIIEGAELSASIYGVNPQEDKRKFPPAGWTELKRQTPSRHNLSTLWSLLRRDDAAGQPSNLHVVYRGSDSKLETMIDATQILGFENELGVTSTWAALSKEDAERLLPLIQEHGQNVAVNVIVAGHSLGGALAAITAFYLRELGVHAEAYAFNTPPFMTDQMPTHIREDFNTYTTLVSAEFDLVTRVLGRNSTAWYRKVHENIIHTKLGRVGKYGAAFLNRVLTGKIYQFNDAAGDRSSLNCTWLVSVRTGCSDVPVAFPRLPTLYHDLAWEAANKSMATSIRAVNETELFAPPPALLHACVLEGNVNQSVARCTFDSDHPNLLGKKVKLGNWTRLSKAVDLANHVSELFSPSDVSNAPTFEVAYDMRMQHNIDNLFHHLKQLYVPGRPLLAKTAVKNLVCPPPAQRSLSDISFVSMPSSVHLSEVSPHVVHAGPAQLDMKRANATGLKKGLWRNLFRKKQKQ